MMEAILTYGTRKSPTGQWSEQDSALVDVGLAGEQHPLRRKQNNEATFGFAELSAGTIA